MHCVNELKECDASVGGKKLETMKNDWINVNDFVKGSNRIHRVYASFLSPVTYTDEIQYMMSHEPHNLQIWCMSVGVSERKGLEELPSYWKFRTAKQLTEDYPKYSVLANIERNSNFCDSRYVDLCHFVELEAPRMRCIFPPSINYKDKELINVSIDEMTSEQLDKLKMLARGKFGVSDIEVDAPVEVARNEEEHEIMLERKKPQFVPRKKQESLGTGTIEGGSDGGSSSDGEESEEKPPPDEEKVESLLNEGGF